MEKEATQVSNLTDLEDEINLWVRQPETAELSKDIVSGHLCSCDNVCVAVVDDSIA